MRLIIEKFNNSRMINWFKLFYYCGLISYNFRHNIMDEKIIEESFELIKFYSKVLKESNKEERLKEYHNTNILMGSFEDWNKELVEYRQARYIQNLIIQLIDCKHYAYARAAYKLIKSEEFESKYFKSKIGIIL